MPTYHQYNYLKAFISMTETQTNAQVYLIETYGTRRTVTANSAVRAHPLTEPIQRRRHRSLRSAASAVLPLSNLDTATAAIWLLRYYFSSVLFSVLKVRNPVD